MLLPESSLNAQAVKASLVGSITDSSGAVVPAADVTITDVNTNINRSTLTNESGYYAFGILNPGLYRVEAKLTGLKTAVRDRVDVLVNTTVRVDLQLQPGTIAETIEVTAAAPILQTDRSDIGGKIETRQLEDLPLVMNRNFQGLVNLTPGTSRSFRPHSEFFNPQDSLSTEVKGRGWFANNVQIEGVDNNHRTGLLTVLIPPIKALQTVDVTTSNYDAELGRAAGAVMNVVLKSGTNAYRGSAYWFKRVNALYARNYFSSSPAPHSVFNQFGVTFGGPIVKDRTFFFADYQGLRDRRGDFFQVSVPAMAWRTGDLSASTTTIYDPSTGTPDGKGRTPFLGNQIPDNRISPLAKKILALVPPPTSSGLQNNYERNTVRQKDTEAFAVKIDHKLRDSDSLSFRYSYSRPKIVDPGLFGDAGGGGKGFAGTGVQRAERGCQLDPHLQSALHTDFRFGVMRYRNDAKNQDSGTNASDLLGIKGVKLDEFTSGLTGINIDGFSNPVVGYSASLPWDSGAETDRKNFAPRFGVAYRLTEKTVIRGGFGLTIDPTYPDDKLAYNYPVKQNNAYNALNSYSAAGSMAAGFPAPLPVVLPPDGLIPAPLAANYIVLRTPLKEGSVQSWNLALQHALPWNLSAEAAYVGNHGVGNPINQNINAGQLLGKGAAGQPLYVKYGRTAATTLWTPFGNVYHALQARLDRRFRNGFALTTAYTFSKAIDYADDNGGLNIHVDYRMSRGRAGDDRTHMYVQSFIYDLPVGPGRTWLTFGPASMILGGWQVAGVLSAYSGTPMTFGYSSATLNAPGNGQRANVSGTPKINYKIGVGEKWFDIGVFSAPATAAFGNAGRNTLSGPGFVNLDMSVFEKIRFTERFNGESRVEMFNVSNTPHFNNPGTTLGNSNFWEVRSSFGESRSSWV